MIRRNRNNEYRTVKGYTFNVICIERLNYNGHWEPDGYDVYLDHKFLKNFCGYPTDTELETCFPDYDPVDSFQ